MGKALIVMVTAMMIVGGFLMYQGTDASYQADDEQAGRESVILAREIARSGLARILTAARAEEHRADGDISVGDLIAAVSPDGDASEPVPYQGGSYIAWIEDFGGGYRGRATGSFGEANYRIDGSSRLVVPDGEPDLDEWDEPCGGAIPCVSAPSQLRATFERSWAGYCSAVYLQRWLPTKVAGETVYQAQEPEMLFPSGHYRTDEDTQAIHDGVLEPGTRINFILSVDKRCALEGQTGVPYDHETYADQRYSFSGNVAELKDLSEGKYAMLEENQRTAGVWRVAYEDLNFSDDKINDVKANGWRGASKTTWQETGTTYGGTGWTYDDDGYHVLQNTGGMPDFSDQVFEIEITPLGEEALEEWLAENGLDLDDLGLGD